MSQNIPFTLNWNAVYIIQDFFAARADPGKQGLWGMLPRTDILKNGVFVR